MLTNIYTDASVRDDTAVTTCLLLTDSNFMGITSNHHSNVHTSLHAELLAIRDALKYFRSVETDTCVTIHCDSYAAIQLVTSGDFSKFKKLLLEITKLSKGLTVDFSLIKGHQQLLNPNKVVDAICNSVLRNVKECEAKCQVSSTVCG